MEKLKQTVLEAMNSANHLHFNLDQFDMDTFREFAKNPKFAEENITNWELYTILRDETLLKKTTFYGEMGKIISAPKLIMVGNFHLCSSGRKVFVFTSRKGVVSYYSYAGKERDAGSGLMYYGARYDDPILARFITPDTVYESGSQEIPVP